MFKQKLIQPPVAYLTSWSDPGHCFLFPTLLIYMEVHLRNLKTKDFSAAMCT